MKFFMMADLEVDKVAEMKVDMVANMEIDKVPDMEVDMLADMLKKIANMFNFTNGGFRNFPFNVNLDL